MAAAAAIATAAAAAAVLVRVRASVMKNVFDLIEEGVDILQIYCRDEELVFEFIYERRTFQLVAEIKIGYDDGGLVQDGGLFVLLKRRGFKGRVSELDDDDMLIVFELSFLFPPLSYCGIWWYLLTGRSELGILVKSGVCLRPKTLEGLYQNQKHPKRRRKTTMAAAATTTATATAATAAAAVLVRVRASVMKNVFDLIEEGVDILQIYCRDEELVFEFIYESRTFAWAAEIKIGYDDGGLVQDGGLVVLLKWRDFKGRVSELDDDDMLIVKYDDDKVFFQSENKNHVLLDCKKHPPFCFFGLPIPYTAEDQDKFIAILNIEPSRLSDVCQTVFPDGARRYCIISVSDAGALTFSAGTTTDCVDVNTDQSPLRTTDPLVKAPTHVLFEVNPRIFNSILPFSSTLTIGFVPRRGIVFEYNIHPKPLKFIRFIFGAYVHYLHCDPHTISLFGLKTQPENPEPDDEHQEDPLASLDPWFHDTPLWRY